MKTSSKLIALAFSAAAWSGAQAQTIFPSETDYYFEVGLVPMEIRENGQTYKPTGMRLILGKNLNRNLAFEGMYAFTVSSDKQPAFDAKSEQYSLSFKPKVGINDHTDAFVRIGYGSSNVTSSIQGSRRITDWSYGIGLQTKINPDLTGQLDYMTYLNKDGLWVRGVGFSLGMRFN
jgi:opacity protein-like surface antigen